MKAIFTGHTSSTSKQKKRISNMTEHTIIDLV